VTRRVRETQDRLHRHLTRPHQLPVHQDVNGIQLVAPAQVWVGASYRLVD
jgi:hypothetical protein